MSKKGSTGYSGILNEPIIPIEASSSDEERLKLTGLLIDKIFALAKHYKIQPGEGMFIELSIALAQEHVPGFQSISDTKKKPGRPQKYNGELGQKLYARVRKHIRATGISEKAAIKALTTLDPEFKGFESDSLWRRYMEVKNGNKKLLGWKKLIMEHATTLNITEEQFEDFIFSDYLNNQ